MTSSCRACRSVLLTPLTLLLSLVPAPSLAAPATQPTDAEVPFISPDLGLDPPQGLLIDAWYRLQLHDQPMGYMRTALQRKADRMETLDYTQIRIARGPITLKVIVKTVTIETVDGKPLEIHTEQVMGNQPVRYDASFNGNMIDLQISQGGNTITRQIPADPDAMLPWKKIRRIPQGRCKPGDSYVERAYAFVSDTKPIAVNNEYIGQTSFTLPTGRTIPALRYKVTNPALATAGEVICHPQLLLPLKLDVPVLGSMNLTAGITSRQQATTTGSGRPAELFESLLIQAKVAGTVDPSQASSVLYTLRFRDDSRKIDLVQTDMQRPTARQPKALLLLVTRRKDRPARLPAAPSTVPSLAPYLQASAYANCDDPRVREMAVEAAGDEKVPLRIAEKLCRYVYQKVQHKGLDIAFATASEVAQTRQGDCTEHAVLLAALARAKGLPARGALGMVAVPGSFSDGTLTFGYHMWTQIYVDGRWMDFDAALNQPRPDATHIVLGISDLADALMPQESVKTFAQLAGQLELTAEPKE